MDTSRSSACLVTLMGNRWRLFENFISGTSGLRKMSVFSEFPERILFKFCKQVCFLVKN